MGVKNTLYVGSLKPWQIRIPPGVGHGYKVIGEGAAMLVYVTDHLYNPKDEGRIPYNDSSIAYDWETAAQINEVSGDRRRRIHRQRVRAHVDGRQQASGDA